MVKRTWLEFVNPELIDLFPLQFVNCDRIQQHDVLYIFDEVGSGKTITSGLIALDYIEQNHKDVLIITTKALSEGEHQGQFLGDWYQKLPFIHMGYSHHVHIINNNYSHIEKLAGKAFGLIIIDEAHLFLTDKTKKRIALEKLVAEKVVFLTATPIKSNKYDLQTYINIAKSMTQKDIQNNWIQNIETIGKEKNALICSSFDITSPVTRYFKDTIQSLQISEFHKTTIKRHETIIHEVGIKYEDSKTTQQQKAEQTVEFLESRLKEQHDARFVIFTRFIEKEARVLRQALEDANFMEFRAETTGNSFAIVSGSNNYELADYSNKTKESILPTVLVVSYQIAEQGVNLPGYNHVINYHIPAFPSAIEQRYGRIDRLSKSGKQYEAIYNCFILTTNFYDSNNSNFYTAISISLNNLLKFIPSRNTLLSRKTLTSYLSEASVLQKQRELFTDALKCQEQIANLYFSLKTDEVTKDDSNTTYQLLFSLYEQVEDFEFNDEPHNIDRFKKALEDVLSTFDVLSEKGTRLAEELLKKYDVAAETAIWDNIFYRSTIDLHENLSDLNAIKEAAAFIRESDAYAEYRNRFERELAPNYRFNQYKKALDYFFYKQFDNNQLSYVFPVAVNQSYQKVVFDCQEIIKELAVKMGQKLTEADMQIILTSINRWAPKLPLFVFFREFERLVGNISRTNEEILRGHDDISNRLCTRKNYTGNVFIKAICQLHNIQTPAYPAIQNEVRGMSYEELTKQFILIKSNHVDKSNNIFGAVITTSKYFKLLYHFSRKEVCSFGKRMDSGRNNGSVYHSIFANIENIKTQMVNIIYQSSIPEEMKVHFKKNYYKEIPKEMIEQVSESSLLDEVNEYNRLSRNLIDFDNQQSTIRNYMSMFMHFVFSEYPNHRNKHAQRYWVNKYDMKLPPNNYHYYSKDYWTIHIIGELFGVKLNSDHVVHSSVQKIDTVTLKILD
ncbi:helicase-related protein [Paenibacillus sp. FSL R7-0272]|uniref:helicase-related protein n=1 Tax=Paenibacillus sp. FSL R7-0272 TaxID=2921679 RepID=UPI0030DC3118